MLEAAPRLKVISRHGGYDNIPLNESTERGIPVTTVGSVNAVSVAETNLLFDVGVCPSRHRIRHRNQPWRFRLVDEASLLAAVKSGRLHGAGLDTFDSEPPPPDSPLFSEPRIVHSPHTAAMTETSLAAM